ncbi:OLC1v1023874C1 [Oldenlandia corymbosa var. corymbosa]|uniref:OLC1v1023874C1 n=1 Tax=Oldenlandia corymbosa var. corymbosa TaxID=529605 RepID=A0AAV1C1V9_OLDCO|nr:OLC1v1023874C1 [Oldenlandia corymbosa var. corymbosa]
MKLVNFGPSIVVTKPFGRHLAKHQILRYDINSGDGTDESVGGGGGGVWVDVVPELKRAKKKHPLLCMMTDLNPLLWVILPDGKMLMRLGGYHGFSTGLDFLDVSNREVQRIGINISFLDNLPKREVEMPAWELIDWRAMSDIFQGGWTHFEENIVSLPHFDFLLLINSLICVWWFLMYLTGFHRRVSCILGNLSLRICTFSTVPDVNKVTLYLQRSRLIDSIRLSLRSNSPESLLPLLQSPALDAFVVNNALKSAPSPDSALLLIEKLKNISRFSHNQQTLYTLAKILARCGQTSKLRALINAIDSGKFTNVARVSFMNRMLWFSLAGDLDEVVSVWDEWRASNKPTCTEAYNIVMSLSAKNGKDYEAVVLFRRIIDEGLLPNSRTYTIVIEHLICSNNLSAAFEVFQLLPQMRIKRSLKQYSVLVDAFCRKDQLDIVRTLINEMRVDGILPGRAMQSSLQRLHEAGCAEETNELIKEMVPDGRIKSIAYTLDGSDDDVEVHEENDHHADVEDAEQVQLKPWLDPAALASALQYWRPEEVSALEDANIIWTTRLVCKMIRSFRSAQTSWQFFCWVAYQPGFTHDVYTMSRMVVKLARHGCTDLVDQLLSKSDKEGIPLSISTARLIIDSYGLSGHGKAALKILQNVKTICGPISRRGLLILYTSILRTLTKCKMNAEALDILEEMILVGVVPEIQTFSGLMHHFAVEGDIKTVQRLFGMVRQSDLEPDAFMYRVLIRAYCKCERAALAIRVFEDMLNSGLAPDIATKDLLVKSLWKEGKLREAAGIEERSEEINCALPQALPGGLYTLNSVDLMRIYDIYSGKFKFTLHNNS